MHYLKCTVGNAAIDRLLEDMQTLLQGNVVLVVLCTQNNRCMSLQKERVAATAAGGCDTLGQWK